MKTRAIALAFLCSTLASIALTVVYATGGDPQLEGALLGLALGALAAGLVLWAHRLMPRGPVEQEREPLSSDEADEQGAEAALAAAGEDVARRGVLVKLLAAAVVALGAVAVFPIRSLGSRPGRSLHRTSWRRGSRLVTSDGSAVRPADIRVGGLLTVFPEGHVDAADSQTVVIRLPRGAYRPLPGREDWAPDGLVAFSKVCTHAGCPVGLYQAESAELFCPCHQSVFAVLEHAKPTSGPATRPLPQLPLAVDAGGYLIARGDFPEPIGPGFWSRGG